MNLKWPVTLHIFLEQHGDTAELSLLVFPRCNLSAFCTVEKSPSMSNPSLTALHQPHPLWLQFHIVMHSTAVENDKP